MKKNIYSLNERIAIAIISAQVSSMRPKGLAIALPEVMYNDPRLARAMELGYAGKPSYILSAIKMINSGHSLFRYYVEQNGDQNGYPSIIVYVRFNRNGRRYEISWHNPLNCARKLIPYLNKGERGHWCGRHDSIDTAVLLYGMLERGELQ